MNNISASDSRFTYIGRWADTNLNSTAGKSIVNGGGNQIRFTFTGTFLALNLYIAAGDTLVIDYRIDGGTFTQQSVMVSGSNVIASGLSNAMHTVEVWTTALSPGWTPIMAFQGVTLDDGADIGVYSTGNRLKALVLGDSIAEGQLILGTGIQQEGRLAFPNKVGTDLGIDIFNHSFGGSKINGTSSYGVPATTTNYQYKASGISKADPRFDFVLIEACNNDTGGAGLTNAYESLIDEIRTDQGSIPIFCMGPLLAGVSSSVATSVQTAATAKSAIYVDTSTWTISRPNAGHPDLAGHTAIAGYLEPIISSNITALSTTPVDWSTLYQTIKGFGTYWCNTFALDGTNGPLSNASMWFDPDKVGLSLAKFVMKDDGTLPANGSPFSWAPSAPGVDLAVAKTISDLGIPIMVTCWQPPVGWYGNDAYYGTNVFLNDGSNYSGWANLMANMLNQCAAAGVNISYLSPFNEPDLGEYPFGPRMDTDSFQSFVISYLKAAIAGSAQPNCKILIPDTAGSDAGADYINAVNAVTGGIDSSIAPILAFHGADNLVPARNPLNWDTWMTELAHYDAWNATMTEGMWLAQRLHTMLDGGCSAYIHTSPYGATDAGLLGPDAPYPSSKKMSVWRQYTNFVRPGFQRASITGAPAGVLVTAYKNGTKRVIIATNTNPAATAISIATGSSAVSASRISTSDTDDFTVSATGISSGTISDTLAANAVITYAWDDSTGAYTIPASPAELISTVPDTTSPTITAFSMPSTSSSLTVAVTSLTATDDVGVTGYLVKESSTTPAAGDAGWVSLEPSSYTFSSAGSKTLYAWAKDAAGNISTSATNSVVITLPSTHPWKLASGAADTATIKTSSGTADTAPIKSKNGGNWQ